LVSLVDRRLQVDQVTRDLMVQFPQAYQMFEPPTLPVDSELDAIAKVLALFNSDERPHHYVTPVSVPAVSETHFK
jgi:hypothetical protein